MKIIVGLGNPGKEYEKTRHNAGYQCVNMVRETFAPEESWKEEKKFQAEVVKCTIRGTPCLLVQPLTYMNNSGESVSKLLHFFKETTENLIVIYDDVDIPLGTLRLRPKGNPGTHNGMKSVIQHVGADFPRIRIGIESRGNLSPEQQEMVDFVLGRFTQKEEEIMEKVLKSAVSAVELIVSGGIEEAMNQYNSLDFQPEKG